MGTAVKARVGLPRVPFTGEALSFPVVHERREADISISVGIFGDSAMLYRDNLNWISGKGFLKKEKK